MSDSASEATASRLYRDLQKRVAGENINSQTLLATDYLNHFNEVHMLLDMLTEMPECLEDVRDWTPKSYQEHFRDSGFQARDLAIEAYEHSPPEHRRAFERTVAAMNALVLHTIDRVSRTIAADDRPALGRVIGDYTPRMQKLIDQCNAIINGARPVIHQEDIDSYFSESAAPDGLDQHDIDGLFD